MDLLARQFLRAVRGHRSQIAFARRLGYSSNPIANWEAGRHFPTAGEALRACARVDLDIVGALGRLGGARAGAPASLDDADLARWLALLRGPMTLPEIAALTGVSRFQVERWLAGRTRPRLPQFFALFEAMTSQLGELLLQLVPLAELPAMAEPERLGAALRALVKRDPWVVPIAGVIATRAWKEAPEPRGNAWIAAVLGIDEEVVDRCVSGLVLGGVLQWEAGRWQIATSLVVPLDPADVPDGAAFWAEVLSRRSSAAYPRDRCHVVFAGMPLRAWKKVQEAVERCKQEIWAAGTDRDPDEVAGFVYLRTVEWIGPDDPSS
jgi:transcriptional regulator with XRE-family HTH domain